MKESAISDHTQLLQGDVVELKSRIRNVGFRMFVPHVTIFSARQNVRRIGSKVCRSCPDTTSCDSAGMDRFGSPLVLAERPNLDLMD
jgi:hypothetical protein